MGTSPRRRSRRPVLLAATATFLLAGFLHRLLPSEGGGEETRFEGPRPVDPAAVAVPEGCRVEAVASGLSFPTGAAFDDQGSRPVFGAGDLLWKIQPGTWYGWPDFFAGRPLTREDWFDPPAGWSGPWRCASPPTGPRSTSWTSG